MKRGRIESAESGGASDINTDDSDSDVDIETNLKAVQLLKQLRMDDLHKFLDESNHSSN